MPPGAPGSEGRGQVKWEGPCPSEELGGSSQAGSSWHGSPWRPLLAPLPPGHSGWQAHWVGERDGHKGVLVRRAWELGWAIPGHQAAQQPQHLQAAAPGPGAEGAGRPRCPLPKAEPRVRVRVLGLWCLLESRGGCATGKGEGHPVRSCLPGVGAWCRLSTPPRPGHLSGCSASGSGLAPAPSSCPPAGPGAAVAPTPSPCQARPPGGRSPAWPATSPSAAS